MPAKVSSLTCSDTGTEIPLVPTCGISKMINFPLREFECPGGLDCPNWSFHFHRREFPRSVLEHTHSVQIARESPEILPVLQL